MPTVQETIQETFWRSGFGDQYTDRNRPDWRKRVPFFLDMLHLAKSPRSILEVGCNRGHNLRAIRAIDPTIAAWGCDINQSALQEAADAGLAIADCSIFALDKKWKAGGFDLVFTCGVLIHVSGQDVQRAMQCIIAASKKYVLAIEYADEVEVEVSYRGHAERLWRRPFGKIYQELGLKLVQTGEASADGFDRCAYWILSK